ncbi:MarR family winged helix-turn-helix transcriptional regulator [Pelagovum pacificum]|uniref:MarR family transcriptional regulator n=1 Tax=Pelagovum pacificum TaxID=2588711 RepID=A0A5C5GE44_9RHOB|nr:MarR family transcriptional regulator [Pelagovum pacificum]QQA43828.1 MarR family transcriptional regulator [Pelagovum pacificum]TNY33042.1 MarR family transcriptional regulator [Pelagovum pacificum]
MTRQPELPDHLPEILARATESIEAGFERITRERHDLSRTEWRVLAHLGSHGELTAARIGEMSGLHKTKLSRAVGLLRGRGLIVRQVIPADRRNARLSLSPEGQIVHDDLAAEAARFEETLLLRLSEEERRTLAAALRNLVLPEPA